MISARINTLAVFFLCLPGLALAHVGDRIYPVAYLSDEIMKEIRLDDGQIEEWFDLVGEPSLTLSDFSDKYRNAPLDPSDLDFRIWLAWHDDPARFYLAFVGTDDVYENTHDYSVDTNFRDIMLTHDSIQLIVDGDHRGGPDLSPDGPLEEQEDLLGHTQYGSIRRLLRIPFPVEKLSSAPDQEIRQKLT